MGVYCCCNNFGIVRFFKVARCRKRGKTKQKKISIRKKEQQIFLVLFFIICIFALKYNLPHTYGYDYSLQSSFHQIAHIWGIKLLTESNIK